MVCRNCGWQNENELRCARCGAELVPKKQNRWILPVLAGAAVAVIIATVVVVISMQTGKTEDYARQVKIAGEYYADKDYDAAIEAYEKALELNDTDEDAYIGLATSYGKTARYQNACSVLESGIKKTGSSELKNMYKKYIELADENEDESGQNGQQEADKGEGYDINKELFRHLLNYKYSDYTRDYGSAGVENKSDKITKMSFAKFNGTIGFVNDDEVTTFDIATGVPYSEMKASRITLDDLSDLIVNFRENMELRAIKSLFGSNIQIKEDKDKEHPYYLYIEYNKCIVKIECSKDGTITSKNAWNEIVTENNTNEQKDGAVVMGTVINASDGKPVKDVKISFRKGKNAKGGSAEYTCKTNSDGQYEQEVEAGIYTVSAEADGYIEEFYEIETQEGETYVDTDIVLVPTLAEGSIRIVLEWGMEPADLDSHLDGTSSTGQNVQVDYRNRTCMIDGVEFANLDLDDTTSYGPETITLNDINGEYVYSVEDFTNAGNASSTALSQSGATVKVYTGTGQPPTVFEVPQGAGRKWKVFSIKNGVVTPINTIE